MSEAASASAVTSAIPEAAPASPDPKPLVVVVEDNKVLFKTYEMMFQNMKELRGFHFAGFESARAALEWLSGLPGNVKPAVLILDWMMDGVNGMDVLVKVRAEPRWSGVPVIMATSNRQRDGVALAMSKGATDYMVKPIQTRVLVGKLEKLLSPKEADKA
jgi:two-component system chemotaxis response regulator CheY